MSKITFRADEDLVERIEARDASKSEIMREALREYLDREESGRASATRAADAEHDPRGETVRESSAPEPARRGSGPVDHAGSVLDTVLAERVDELVSERLAAWEARRREREAERAQDVNVNVTLESDAPVRGADASANERSVATDESSDADSASNRAPASEASTCGQCGESLSDDHVYCPNCGEKAARRVFCECGDEVRSDWGFCPSCGRRTPAADVLDRS